VARLGSRGAVECRLWNSSQYGFGCGGAKFISGNDALEEEKPFPAIDSRTSRVSTAGVRSEIIFRVVV